jgi:hypothetical protein
LNNIVIIGEKNRKFRWIGGLPRILSFLSYIIIMSSVGLIAVFSVHVSTLFPFGITYFIVSCAVIIYNYLDSDTIMLHGKLMGHDI